MIRGLKTNNHEKLKLMSYIFNHLNLSFIEYLPENYIRGINEYGFIFDSFNYI